MFTFEKYYFMSAVEVLKLLPVAITLCLLPHDGVTAMQTVYSFPPLTGQHAVGTQIFNWTDASRTDSETGKFRELVVQVWYPADGQPGKPAASYAYESLEMFRRGFQKHYKACTDNHIKEFDAIKTHAVPSAVPLVKASYLSDHGEACRLFVEKYPVVIFGHGYGMNSGSYSLFCEDIASHGYIVLMVMHTYVNELARFQDGREIALDEDNMRPRSAELIETCFADIQFMLNQIMLQSSSVGFDEQLYRVCDFNSIGIVGHSLGGIMAAQLCRRDDRIKAGISLDGPLFGQNATKPFNKPFMLMHAPSFYDMFGDDEAVIQAMNGTTKQEWINGSEEFFKTNGSDTQKICIEGAEHLTFTDQIVMAGFFRKIFNDESIELDEGNVDQAGIEAIRRNIVLFLDQHLKI